jgi:hypothetical protein
MRDAANPAPDLALILHPEDEARFVAMCNAPCGRGAAQPGFLYAVLHRRHGTWTHLYRVVPDPRPGRQFVFLEKTWPGDRLAEAENWARQRFSSSVAMP